MIAVEITQMCRHVDFECENCKKPSTVLALAFLFPWVIIG